MKSRRLRHIINEEIENLINEGYFGKRYSKEIDDVVDEFFEELQRITYYNKYFGCDNKQYRIQKTLYLNGLGIGIKLLFYNGELKKNSNGGFIYGYMRPYDVNHYEYKIYLGFDVGITSTELSKVIFHELTHIMDYIKESEVQYKSYHHEFDFENTDLPNPIVKEIFYRLWDTSERNAYQSGGIGVNIQGYVDKLYNLIERVYSDKSVDWNEVKEYLIKSYSNNKTKNRQITKNTSLEKVKKYFIETSLKLLKKFIKKIDL